MLVSMPMPSPLTHPWRPHPRQAKGLILLLALLVFLSSWGSLQRRLAPQPVEDRVSTQGRLLDLQLSALGSRAPWARLQQQARNPWDRAVLALHAVELGQASRAQDLMQGAPMPLAKAWTQAIGGGSPLSPLERDQVELRLGRTYATELLRARLMEAEHRDAQAFRQEAARAIHTRLALLGALMALAGLALLGGLGFSLFLALHKPTAPAPLPVLELDGQTLTILFLGWFLAMQVSGTLVQILLAILPFLSPWALSWAYLFHALIGTGLLCSMEGIGFRELWQRMTPGPLRANLGWGLGYLGLTVVVALALSLALSPLFPNQEPPQRELVELLARARTLGTALPLFLTVAVLAPCFEELMFRGCLLPALRRSMGPWPALLLGALAFGAMHLQPMGLPLLSLLGLTMGLAFLRTGSLWTPILVHGCWNGAQFLLMQLLY